MEPGEVDSGLAVGSPSDPGRGGVPIVVLDSTLTGELIDLTTTDVGHEERRRSGVRAEITAAQDEVATWTMFHLGQLARELNWNTPNERA